jgi:DNA-3-methyladenine glycosylase I
MSVATKLQLSAKPVSEPRAILGLAGNRLRVSEELKRKAENPKRRPQRQRNRASEIPEPAARNNASVDSSCSSDSSSSGSLAKKTVNSRTVRRNGLGPVKVVPDGAEAVALSSPKISGPPKRCDWITAHSGE